MNIIRNNIINVSLLLLAGIISFYPVLFNNFINFDDPQYVYENDLIHRLDISTLKTFFTKPYFANYQPLVLISYSIEYHFKGNDPFIYHLDNLILHLLNVVLVYFLINALVKNNFISLITALLFSLHPLHVEPIAWISSRKDLMYGFFFLSSTFFYLHSKQIEKYKSIWFVLSLILFACSFLSKAQAVILPLVLLLFEWFRNPKVKIKNLYGLIPFFGLSILLGSLAVSIQKSSGAVQDYQYFEIYKRVLFSCYSQAMYFLKTVFPVDLSVFYPYPETKDQINSFWVYISPLGIILMVFLIIKLYRTQKLIVFGIIFFIVNLLLVIQIIPVGDAIIADRYTYIALLGFCLILAYLLDKMINKKRFIGIMITIELIILFGYLSWKRCYEWKDSITLYTSALKIYPDIPILRNNRGAAYSVKNRNDEALIDFVHLVKTRPRFPGGLENLAILQEKMGKKQEAIHTYSLAIRFFPKKEDYSLRRGLLFSQIGKTDSAIFDFTKFISINPKLPDPYYHRSEMYARIGKMPQALEDINKVILLKPNYAQSFSNRGMIYGLSGKTKEAIEDFSFAIKLNPNLASAYFNRSITYQNDGNYLDAFEDAKKARELGYKVNEEYIKNLEMKK